MAITTINDAWDGQPRREIETVLKNELKALKSADTNLQGQIDLLGGESGASSPSEFVKALMGGVKIAFHRKYKQGGEKGDGAPLAVGIDQWAQYARWGNRADGVLVLIDGGNPILVGLQQANLAWSALDFQNCGTEDLPLIKSRSGIGKDMDGEKRTALILANEAQNYGNAPFERFAAGWCSVFASDGVSAGKWWCPSIGELMAIWSHVDAINICIDVINANLHDGESAAMKIGNSYYQSSTEYSKSNAWVMEMSAGFSFQMAKSNATSGYVLPISSLDAFMNQIDVETATIMATPTPAEVAGAVEI